MAEALIDEVIDIAAVTAQLDTTKKGVQDLIALIQSVKGKAIDITTSTSVSDVNRLGKELDALTDKTKKQTQAILENAKAEKENAAAALFSAKATTEEAKARYTNAKAANEEAKASNETAKAKRDEEKATRDSTKAKETDAKLVDQAIDDYFQLSKAYNEASLKAKNYVLRLGENHPIAVQAVKDANDLANVLKKVDASVGQNQRNVGNYKSAFDGLGFSFTQIGRELPSLAINVQTFLLAISNNLPMVADEIRKATAEIKAMKEAGKETPSLFSRIKGSILSFNTVLSLAITGLVLFGKNLFGANDGSKQLKESTEALTKALADQEKQLNRNSKLVDDQTKLDLERIKQSGGDKQKLYERELQGLKDKLNLERQQNLNIQDQLTKDAEKYYEYRQLLASVSQYKISKSERKALKEKYDVYVKDLKASEERIADLENDIEQKKAERITERIEDDKEAAEKRRKAAIDAAKDSKEAADAELQFQFDIKELELQRIIEFNKEIVEDESKSLYVRLAALRRFKDASVELFIERAELEKKLGTKTETELKLVEQKKLDALLRLDHDYVKARADIYKDANDKRVIDEKDIQDKLEKVIEDGYQKFLKREADRLERTKAVGKQRLEIIQKGAEDERALYKDLYDELNETITEFFIAGDDRRIADLEKEIAAIEERRARDTEFIDQTVTNRQDAAAQIAIINDQAAGDTARLVQKQKDIERDKANIERLSKIAEIAGTTASGILNLNVKAAEARATAALLAANPLTAAFAPNALLQSALIQGQIPFVIAAGALQLAKLALPHFAEGGVHRGGLLVAGDGGRAEGLQLPDGTLLKTPATDTIYDAPAGTVIHKDYNEMMAKATVSGIPKFASSSGKDGTGLIISELKNVTKTIKKIPQPIIKVQNLISSKIRGNNYVTRQFS